MSDADRVSDLLVEQLALGELSPEQAETVRRRLGDTLDARLAELAASDRAILEAHPPPDMVKSIGRRLDRERSGTSEPPRTVRLPWLLPAAVAMAAVLAWWWVRPRPEPTAPQDLIARSDPPTPSGPEHIIIKGDPRLIVHRQTASGTELLADGDRIQAGDRLQVSLVAAGRRSGVIVSIDGAGAVTLHFPGQPTSPAALPAGGPVPLDHAYELDDAPGFERFLFVTATQGDVDVDRVMEAARTLATQPDADTAPLAIPSTWLQTSVLLRKN